METASFIKRAALFDSCRHTSQKTGAIGLRED